MKMDDMVSYLESKGFKVRKQYVSEKRHYEFLIEKDGKYMVSTFEYPDGASSETIHLAQEGFLDSLIDKFESEYGRAKNNTERFDRAFEDVVDRLRLHVAPRGFSVSVNKSAGHFPIYTVIVRKQSYYQTWSFTYDDLEISTFARLKQRVDWLMDNVDEEIETGEVHNYIQNDLKQTKELVDMLRDKMGDPKFRIKKVIFNNPATIVLWTDGTKTVVKAENETFDEEKGLAMAISKKALGNKGNYYNTFTKWLPKEAEIDGNSMSAFLDAWGNLFGFASKTTACLKKENDFLYDKLDRADAYITLLEAAIKSRKRRDDLLTIIEEYWGDGKNEI